VVGGCTRHTSTLTIYETKGYDYLDAIHPLSSFCVNLRVVLRIAHLLIEGACAGFFVASLSPAQPSPLCRSTHLRSSTAFHPATIPCDGAGLGGERASGHSSCQRKPAAILLAQHRSSTEYDRIRCYVWLFDPDILAVQEVDGEAALSRVVDTDVYDVYVDDRPKGSLNGQQNTGFAVKRGLTVVRQPDFQALDIRGDGSLRYGTRIDLTHNGLCWLSRGGNL
jgi:hypothetical protein